MQTLLNVVAIYGRGIIKLETKESYLCSLMVQKQLDLLYAYSLGREKKYFLKDKSKSQED